jgi:DNA-binding response OmpR family regulator
MRILISDPDWRFAQQATGYLEAKAHLVVHQTDPAVAEDVVARWRPDVVILAAEHAETGLLEAILERPARPAVLLTEHLDRYDRAWRVWQAGGDDLLMKPVFNGEELRLGIVTARENAATGRRDDRKAASA